MFLHKNTDGSHDHFILYLDLEVSPSQFPQKTGSDGIKNNDMFLGGLGDSMG